jgi:hypothetical protein
VCGVLYWEPEHEDSLWNVVYDLRTQQFMHSYTLDDPPLSQVPLRYLSDAANYFRRVAALDDPELKAEADRLFNRFSDYMIAAVTLGDMSIQDIAPIFERINSTATPLTIVDLMRAATWDPEFDLRDAIDGVLANLKTRDFEMVDRKTILRAVAAAAGFGFAVDDIDKLRTKSVDDLKVIIAAVEEASKRAVDFLTAHIHAPEPRSLPYANQFAVLTELFRRSPSPSTAHFEAIERWFWRTTLSGYFGGWNTGQMSRDWQEVKRFTEDPTVTELEVMAPLPRHEVWRVTQFRSNSAVSKMLALMMSYANPRDLITGQRLELRKSLSWSNDREFHHFFPKDYLKTIGIVGGQANPVANLVLLSSASNISISGKAPADYLSEIREAVGEAELLTRLESVLVSKEAYAAALKNDYRAFIEIRAANLHQRAMALVGEPTPETDDAGAPVSGDPGESLVSDSVPHEEAAE